MEGGDLRVTSIDERVVRMLFDNKLFEQGVATTLESLDKLNKGLKLQGATKGLQDVGEAAKSVSLKNLEDGVDHVASKFNLMSVVAFTAISNITNRAIDAGIRIAKAFTIDPVKDGFANYETQINAVQTILANTGLTGAAGLSKVNAVLADLNKYANQTVYNFSDMTKNIGTFTAAGVGLQTSVDSIKGIANLAALSGASADQASGAMYQLSQAIAAGSVKLQDWNSVVNAGLGGKVFQNALIDTARASGVAIDSIIKKSGSFRESLQQGWLTSGILTKTLSQFTGDLSAAQLKAMGFTAQQAAQIEQLGQTAVNAATKIKTMSQLTQALKEEVGTAYASIFKTVFGDINQATDLFTGIHNVAENALTGPIYSLNKLLQGWDALGGRKELIVDLTAIFHDLGAVVNVVKSAFREIFPPATAEGLYNATLLLENLADKFKMGEGTAGNLKRTLAGVFSILDDAIVIVKDLAHEVFNLFDYVGAAPGDILSVTARVGDLLVAFNKWLKTSDDVTTVFHVIGSVIQFVISAIAALGGEVEKFWDRITGKTDLSKPFKDMGSQLKPIDILLRSLNGLWSVFTKHLGDIEAFVQPIASKFLSFFKNLGKSIADAIHSLNFQDVVSLFNTGLFAALVLLLKKFVDKFRGGGGGLGDLISTIKESFETLNGTLETMQKTLKAATLLEIATAIGILAISVIALSRIDSEGLLRAGSAITVMFTELMGSLVIFDKFVEGEGWVKMPVMIGSLILLATAIDILVIAVKLLAGMDWSSLTRGLTGLGILLAELVTTIKLMGNPEGLISTSLGLNAFAKAINTLAKAVISLSGLSWAEMAKGLTGIAGLLTALALFSKFAEANKLGVSAGIGIILLATAMKILASAMQDFSKFSWTEIGKGLASMGGGLALIAGALKLIPPASILSAVGVLIVASSLGLIADAIGKMGNFSWSQIGKGLVTLAGAMVLIAAALKLLPPSSLLSAAAIFIVATSLGMISDALAKMGGQSWTSIAKALVELAGALGIIAVAVIFMEDTLAGAAALLVVAAALEVLLPVIKELGTMGWASLAEALVGLAGVFVILGAAAIVLSPLTPVLLALGAAISLLGIGMALTGAGVFLFATALSVLAVSGAAGAAALVGIVTAMLGLLPAVAKEIGLAVIVFAQTISTAGPAILGAMVTVILAMAAAITKTEPTVVKTMLSLLLNLLQQLVNYVPKLIDAGGNLIVALLNGIAKKIPGIVTAAVNVVVAFINAVGSQGKPLSDAGFKALINFINGVADSIRQNTPQLVQAGKNLASAIISGLTGGLFGGLGAVASAAGSLASAALKAAKGVLDSHSPSKKFHQIGMDSAQGLANGLTANVGAVEDASSDVGKRAIVAMGKSLSGLSTLVGAGFDLNPTVTPVIDLTNVKKGVDDIGLMFSTHPPVKIDTSYSQASTISNQYPTWLHPPEQFGSTVPANLGNNVTFNQYNSSPKALSNADIYRQTKNQLSQVRGVLVYQGVGNDQPG
jgi:tape measure domain-containing protein